MSKPPTSAAARRALLTEQLTDIVLAEGLGNLALRPAAARLGTSDRMLLYYFETKAALVMDVLQCLSLRVAAALESRAKSGGRVKPHALLVRAREIFAAPEMAPFMILWAEIRALAARGEEPYAAFARETIAGWLAWLEVRIDAPSAKRAASASALLTIIEGATAMEMARPGSSAAGATLLAKSVRTGG